MLQAIQAALAIIAAVRQFLPEIIALITDVETAMPGSPVDARLDIVVTILKTTIGGIDASLVDVKAVWPVIEAVITSHMTSAAPAAAAVAAA